jgi:hypothetical protein
MMIVPTINTVPTGVGRLMSPALPAVDAVRAVRPVAPGVDRGLDKTGRRDQLRASLRARVALGLDAVLGPADPETDRGAEAGDNRQPLDQFVDTLEAALQAIADTDAPPEAGTDRLTLLVRLAYGADHGSLAQLIERLQSDDIAQAMPAVRPLLGALGEHFEQLAARRRQGAGIEPTLARLLKTVAEERGDLISAEA